MDQVCPWCKTTKYRNPNMELMVNVCGHNICETCVELLFVELRLKGWAHTASESLSFFREVVNVPKYDENDNDSNYPRIISHNEAHSERCTVTGVAWCPVQGGAGRDSGAEDGVVSDQSEAAVSQCQPIRALCFGEDLAAGHGEGHPHTAQVGQWQTNTGWVTSH